MKFIKKEERVKLLARKLLNKHGLNDWHCAIEWQLKSINGSKNTIGGCSPPAKQIGLSREHVVSDSLKNIKNTILHEIAHALTFHDHDEVFYAKCVEIGAEPQEYADYTKEK